MIEELIEIAATIVEVVGVGVIVAGAVVALLAIPRAKREKSDASPYTAYRRTLGKAILLGLEFLVAADIIRTVSTVPTLDQVIVLAVIVLIRTFLSFTLEVELEGHWPWKRTQNERSRDG